MSYTFALWQRQSFITQPNQEIVFLLLMISPDDPTIIWVSIVSKELLTVAENISLTLVIKGF